MVCITPLNYFPDVYTDRWDTYDPALSVAAVPVKKEASHNMIGLFARV
jgi:hypothetical protein